MQAPAVAAGSGAGGNILHTRGPVGRLIDSAGRAFLLLSPYGCLAARTLTLGCSRV